jgi:hypothetical protein
MDFIEGLPESNGCTTLLVVTDRLSKDVILIPLKDTTAETVAHNFLCYVVAYHWLPDAIVSDRGTQFTSHFWAILTKMMRITRRLSTAWHPQTDGSTERMNSTIEAYLHAYIEWAQSNWVKILSMASIAIKGREARSTRVSPFFLQYGYNVDSIQLDVSQGPNREELEARVKPDFDKAKAIVEKFKQVFDIAQTTMAEAQQEQERQANRHRHEQPKLQVNDKVWLSYRKQLSNGRPNKKLDWKNAKYTVTEVINSHSVRLNTPPGIHNVFHVDRLRLASSDPFPSQPNNDTQPAPVLVMENLSLKWNRSWLKSLTGTDCSLQSSGLYTPSPPLNQQKTFRTTAPWMNGKCSQLLTATNNPSYFQLDSEETTKDSSQDANHLTKTGEGG